MPEAKTIPKPMYAPIIIVNEYDIIPSFSSSNLLIVAPTSPPKKHKIKT